MEKLKEAIIQSQSDAINKSIGIQKEKPMHKILKYYLSSDPTTHEIKIKNFYVDIFKDEMIYEIQTANFNAIRQKLISLLDEHKLTIVYPAPRQKEIYMITDAGEFIKKTKSPKKGTPLEILLELSKIKPFLNHPNLFIKIIYMDVEEYRTIKKKRHFRSKGYEKYKQLPQEIVKHYDLNDKKDYINLLDELGFKEKFTRDEFSKKTKISLAKSSYAISVLQTMDIIEFLEKDQRKKVWRIKKEC